MFVALTLGIGFAAINTGNNLLHLVLGMMLALIVASGILSELTLRDLWVERRMPARLYAGTPFLMGFVLHNRKLRAASYAVSLHDTIDGVLAARKAYVLKVGAGKQQQASYQHVFARRGRHRIQGPNVRTRFPFGFFEKSTIAGADSEVVVYPQVVALTTNERRALDRTEGRFARVGRRAEFHGLREYREGDDPRDIFWRKSATIGRVLTKEYEEPRGRRTTIFVDNRSSTTPSSRDDAAQEELVRRAASLAAHLLGQGTIVALASYTTQVALGSGPTQLDRILHALALLGFVPQDTARPPAIGRAQDQIYLGLEPASEQVELSVPPNVTAEGRERDAHPLM